MLDNIYHLLKLSAELHHCPEVFVLGYIIWCIDANIALKTFLYEFHVNELDYVLFKLMRDIIYAIFGMFNFFFTIIW